MHNPMRRIPELGFMVFAIVLRKRAYGGGIADCSKTASLFSLRTRQSSGMATPEELDQVPFSIIGGASS
eukprot:COSAG06_NODE_2000_length_7870_cov_3.580363_1_plen_69_part_00